MRDNSVFMDEFMEEVNLRDEQDSLASRDKGIEEKV